MSQTQVRYKAFISYSHADRAFTRTLHRYLEGFKIPKNLVGTGSDIGIIPDRLGSFFVDREELPSAPDLSSAVNKALSVSDFLIVVCSPESARSRFVNEEILAYKRLGRPERILCIIVSGEPNTDEPGMDESQECFSPALKYHLDSDGELSRIAAEPIAADARRIGDGYKSARLKLVAGLLGVGFDHLKQRELQRQNRRLIGLSLASFAGMLFTASLTFLAIDARNDAERHREEADNLIGFMLGDLRNRLDEVGRLDILDTVVDRTISYFAKLPTDEQTAHTKVQRATALLQLGQVQQARGDVEEAIALFTESLQALEQMCGDIATSTDADCLFQLGQAYFWVGDVDWSLNNYDEASETFLSYLTVSQRLVDLEPTSQLYQKELGWGYSNLAIISDKLGDQTRALKLSAQAVAISESLNEQNPDDQDLLMMLAELYSWRGNILYDVLQLEPALAYYQKFWKAVETGSLKDPKNTLWLSQKVLAYRLLGKVMMSLGRLEESKVHFERSARSAEDLLVIEPKNNFWQVESAVQKQTLIQIALRQNQFDKARTLLEAGIASVGAQLINNTSSLDWQSLKFSYEILQLKLLVASGEFELAWEKTLPLLDSGRSLNQRYPDDKSITFSLCELLLTASLFKVPTEPNNRHTVFLDEGWEILAQPGLAEKSLVQTLSMKARFTTVMGIPTADNIYLSRLREAGYRGPELGKWPAY